MATAGTARPPDAPASDQPGTLLHGSSQPQLEALRAAVDVRLAALEAALADPSQADSLERLILDLSRLATDEAQAAAARACCDVRLQADTEFAQARKAAQTALAQERAAGAELRRGLEQANGHIAAAGRDKEHDIRALTERFEETLATERTALRDLERAAALLEQRLGTAEQQFEAEHESNAALRLDLERAERLSTQLERQQAEHQSQLETERQRSLELRAAQDTLNADIARERQRRADAEQECTQALARFEAERTATANLRSQLETERTTAAGLQLRLDAERAAAADLQSQLGTERTAAGRLQLQLEAERTAPADLQLQLKAERAAAADLQSRLDAERATVTDLQAQLTTERTAAARLQSQLEAERMAPADLQLRLDAERATAADLQSQFEAERMAAADLRESLMEARQQLSLAASETTDRAEGDQQIQHELAFARAEVDALRGDLEKARAHGVPASHETDATARETEATRTRQADAVRHREVKTKHAQEKQAPPAHKKEVPLPAPIESPPPDEDGWRPVPLATRYTFPKPIEILVNGGAAALCDLSASGCQLLSATALKPRQTVKLLLASANPSIACAGKVVWAEIESPKAGRMPHYRVGVQFTKADESAIEAFAARHGKML